TLPGRAAQRDVAGRRNPLAAGRRHRRRDPQSARRPFTFMPGLGRLAQRQAPDVLETFYLAAESYGYPAKFLSDNAAVFSGTPRKGRVVLESELDRLGIESRHSSPYHP